MQAGLLRCRLAGWQAEMQAQIQAGWLRCRLAGWQAERRDWQAGRLAGLARGKGLSGWLAERQTGRLACRQAGGRQIG